MERLAFGRLGWDLVENSTVVEGFENAEKTERKNCGWIFESPDCDRLGKWTDRTGAFQDRFFHAI